MGTAREERLDIGLVAMGTDKESRVLLGVILWILGMRSLGAYSWMISL